MGVLADYGIKEGGKAIGDYIYRDRTISSDQIAKEAMTIEEKFDYIKVKFLTVGKQKMIHYKNGFEGPAKDNSNPKLDGDAYMKKGELTLNYQLPVMTNGIGFVVDTNHNREKLRKLLKKEKSSHYEYYYDGNTQKRRVVDIELGPYIRLLSEVDIMKNKEGASHLMSLSPTDKAIFEGLQKELAEAKDKLLKKEWASKAKDAPKSKVKSEPQAKTAKEKIAEMDKELSVPKPKGNGKVIKPELE